MTFADQILRFYKALNIEEKLPKSIMVLNPYQNGYAFSLCEQFYQRYYTDEKERVLLLGINPGRFGSGATGISFTDPILLETECGIANTLPKKPELSASFIYKVIHAYGGPKKFYKHFFISAVSPLGFTSKQKNINYYDQSQLQKSVTPFIIESIQQLLLLPVSRKKCYCIGEGKNHDFLKNLNEQHHWFNEIIPLPHPRFIMQYKRKKITEYVDEYLKKISN